MFPTGSLQLTNCTINCSLFNVDLMGAWGKGGMVETGQFLDQQERDLLVEGTFFPRRPGGQWRGGCGDNGGEAFLPSPSRGLSFPHIRLGRTLWISGIGRAFDCKRGDGVSGKCSAQSFGSSSCFGYQLFFLNKKLCLNSTLVVYKYCTCVFIFKKKSSWLSSGRRGDRMSSPTCA